eukprot:3878399-Amphidinium_carterae.1
MLKECRHSVRYVCTVCTFCLCKRLRTMVTIAIGSSSHNGQSATVKTLVLSLSTVTIDIPGLSSFYIP